MSEAPDESLAVREFLERNDTLVKEAFQRGEFDYLEAAFEVDETDFFRAITEKKVLEKLSKTYPTPRKKHDVPLWVYVASDIAMRFHNVNQFYAFPYVVRSGGMLQAFGSQMGHKAIHPDTGDTSLRCEGFNRKNSYDRQTPCDQDYLRKMARGTDAQKLLTWFNRDVVGIFRQHHALDAEGIFIGDATYLMVPDNPNYKGSSRMCFDTHNHPVNPGKLTAKQRESCVWRRCYKMVSLIHTNRDAEFFLYAGVTLTAGKNHENPLLYQLVEQFITYHGKGIIKKLILDRGFLDGFNIGRCKTKFGIDIVIPARENMEVYKDVVGLAEAGYLSFTPYVPQICPLPPLAIPKPEVIRKRERTRQKTLAQRKRKEKTTVQDPSKTRVGSEVALVNEVESFTQCPVPLSAVVNRESYANGTHDYWVLLTTETVSDPLPCRHEYALRTVIEERHRQLKCFAFLQKFSSTCFNLITNQVVFILLTYSFLQWYLVRINRKDLTRRTPPRIRDILLPTLGIIILYYKNCAAFLHPLEHQELVLTLKKDAHKKILAKTRRLRRELAHLLNHPRAP